MKNPFKRSGAADEVPEPEPEPAFVVPAGEGSVVVFGSTATLERLGESAQTLPAPLVRCARAVFSAAADVAGASADNPELSGAYLKLTDESRRLLDTHDVLTSGGQMLGMVTGDDGRIAKLLRFETPTASPGAGASLPALAGAAVLQQQMLVLEQRLDELQASVDYLTQAIHSEIGAEVSAAIDILDDVYDSVLAGGEVSDDHWQRIANVELSIKRHHARTTGQLGELDAALDGAGDSIGARVKALSTALRDQHADEWLALHVQAERALTQWEVVHLLRRLDHDPGRADEFIATAKDAIAERHQAMAALAERIATHLDDGGHTNRLLDKLRIVSRSRLRTLLLELDQLLQAYRSSAASVGIELPLPAAPAGDDGEPSAGAWERIVGEVNGRTGRVLELAEHAGASVKDRLRR